MQAIQEQLDRLSLRASNTTLLSHPDASSLAEWCSTVTSLASDAAALIVPVKSLLLKPSSKATCQHPILVVTRAHVEYASSALGKAGHLGEGVKEARPAADDYAMATFAGCSKMDVTPFHAKDASAPVTLVLDAGLLNDVPAGTQFAFRAFSSSASFLVSAASFATFIQSLEKGHILVDFSTLSASKPAEAGKKAAASAAPAAMTTPSQSAPAEGLALAHKKEEDFSNWYSQVLLRTEMLDYYDISGCYILRPWSYSIWKKIQTFFGSAIEDLGVEDCYFPMFVSNRSLNREKDHIEGFSPEVAWVTKAGQADLAEHIAIRPTSETVMYPYYASWLKSHRDLPLRLNQWCNVVRWEFKHPQPFLRTREFLWQEGHTAFATKKESDQEVREILDLYRRVYEDLLAVPVIPGQKSEKEKFAGGLYTTTVEGFIPTTGRAIQGATSHCLGQNFSKMFEIMVENEEKERINVWQNSWGITTRTIGVMVMVHGDDKGLVLPPRVASIQVIVIPVGITAKSTDAEKQMLMDKAVEVVRLLKASGIRAKEDIRTNYTPGFKYNHWELKGVPIRLEVGPKDVAKNEVRAVRRDVGSAQQLSMVGLGGTLNELLETIQLDMFTRAKAERDSRLVRLESWDGFVRTLNSKCMVMVPWCEGVKCEEEIKERSSKAAPEDVVDDKAPSMGAKSLCIPFAQPEKGVIPGVTKCFACGVDAKSYTLFGRSY